MHRFDLLGEIYALMAGPPVPEPGPRTLLQFLLEAVYFPLSRVMHELEDAELDWAPVPDAKPIGWIPSGHDPSTDPFTTIGWRWEHFCQELHDIAGSDICLGREAEPAPEIVDAASAVASLTAGIRRAARAIASTTDERLDEEVENEFGRHSRRHWVTLFLVEAVHHAAEIGVLRDLYRLRHHLGRDNGSPTI